MKKIKKLLYNKNQSEYIFAELRKTKWWARLINSIFYLSIIFVLVWFLYEVYMEPIGWELFDLFYAFIAMGTILLGLISLSKLLLWLSIYIIYGKIQKTDIVLKPYYLQTTVWIYVIFIIFGLIWAILGS